MAAERSPWPINVRRIGDRMTRHLWTAGFILAALQSLFFLYVAIFPLGTVGDPAWERPLLRMQAWEDTVQLVWFAIYLCVVIGAVWMAERAGLVRFTILTLLTMFTAHALIVGEQFYVLNSFGELRIPRPNALAFVAVSRGVGPALALLSLYFLAMLKIRATASDR